MGRYRIPFTLFTAFAAGLLVSALVHPLLGFPVMVLVVMLDRRT